MATSKSTRTIRVGVIGVGRGNSFATGAKHVGMQLVALCDTWKEKLKKVGKQHGVATYTDFDRFLEHEMDAVILANYCHQHAPFAIKALRAGKHVMSETAACRTMAEGVDLCRTVEKTGKIYMFAENYPYSVVNQEMRKLYQAGEIGAVRYAEGEYNHPGNEDWRLSISPGLNHWRNWLPPTFYCSHALAPLMYVTDTMPVKLNSLSITQESIQSPAIVKVSDPGCIILVRMDNGAVFRIFGLGLGSIHRVRYEFHGDRGLMGTAEGNAWGGIRIHHEDWLRKPGEVRDRSYSPDWPEHGDLARQAGHGGGDFWTGFHFANAIRSGKQPYLNVYRGVAMAAVGILGCKSAFENGRPFDVPDFKKESVRKAYENDRWSSFPEDAGPGQPPPSIRGYVKPGAAARAYARKLWLKLGYKGKDI